MGARENIFVQCCVFLWTSKVTVFKNTAGVCNPFAWLNPSSSDYSSKTQTRRQKEGGTKNMLVYVCLLALCGCHWLDVKPELFILSDIIPLCDNDIIL